MKSGPTRLSLLWGLLFSMNCWSATVLPLGLERLNAAAELVFDGECISNEVAHDPISGMTVTYTTFNILENLKGPRLQTYTIKQIGGSLPEDGGAWVIPGVPRFAEGQRYILFVPPPSELGFASPVGLAQGRFDVLDNSQGHPEVSNGRDIDELLAQVPARHLPPRVSNRLATIGGGVSAVNSAARARMDLDDFLNMMRSMRDAQ